MPFLMPCSVPYSGPPTSGARDSVVLMYSSTFSYRWLTRIAARCSARPPIVGWYDQPLSFTIMISRESLAAAMLFSASQAIPPVSAPSPITATTVRSGSPRSLYALASPSA